MITTRIYKIFDKNKVVLLQVRLKHSANHWSVVQKKNKPVDKALEHFDDFYKSIFTNKWPLIRQGLLDKQKYVAIINNYGDSNETMKNLESFGALNIRTLFKIQKEYLKETLKTSNKRKLLKKIFKLDKAIDDKLKQTDNNTDNSDNYKEMIDDDTRRLVDSKDPLSLELLNEFIPVTEITGKDDYIPESDYYKYYDCGSFNVNIKKDFDINFPENLNIYCYEEDNYNDFEPSKIATTGVLNYYLMNGASILPILALDLKPNDKFLDLCAAPGGKSLLALQTLYPDVIVANDISMSRTNRIYKIFRQFLYDFDDKWLKTGRIKISCKDGRYFSDNEFDKILVDVPCTTDRQSLQDNENNLFKPSKVRERLKLPELQCKLLTNAIKLVKKDGIVVYSTCSLSPIQNDGVVGMALKQLWEETKIEVIVRDLSPALLQAYHVFKLGSNSIMKFGHLVIPCPTQNFGPMYFCKLQRIN